MKKKMLNLLNCFKQENVRKSVKLMIYKAQKLFITRPLYDFLNTHDDENIYV